MPPRVTTDFQGGLEGALQTHPGNTAKDTSLSGTPKAQQPGIPVPVEPSNAPHPQNVQPQAPESQPLAREGNWGINPNDHQGQTPAETAVQEAPATPAEAPPAQPQEQPASAQESQEEARIPYSRFKTVNDELKSTKSAVEKVQEEIQALKQKNQELETAKKLAELRAAPPPDNYEELSAYEQGRWWSERQLQEQQLLQEQQPAQAPEKPAEYPAEIQQLLLREKLGISMDQAALVQEVQAEKGLEPHDALAVASYRNPDAFSATPSEGTGPTESFSTVAPASGPAPTRVQKSQQDRAREALQKGVHARSIRDPQLQQDAMLEYLGVQIQPRR